MPIELVRTQAADGLRLDGAIFQPSGPMAGDSVDSVDAAILIHGVGGNFYSSSLFDAMLEPLVSRGIAVLRINTRGRDGVFTAGTTRGPRRFGAAFEIVDECRLDLQAWAEFLARQGFKRIALVGHSLGAVKAIYAAAHCAEATFDRIAALSPPRLSYRAFNPAENAPFRETMTLAETLVEDGRPDELIQARYPTPMLISAGSYVDKYGRQERYDVLRYIPKVPSPLLLLYGEKELASGELPFAGLDRAAAAAARPGQPLGVRIVPGADHFYSGVQDAAARQVAEWLATNA